jgi:hypothetical protein
MNDLKWETIRKYIIKQLGEEPLYKSTDEIVEDCELGRKRVFGEQWAQEIIEWAEKEDQFKVERTYTRQHNRNLHVPVDLTFFK